MLDLSFTITSKRNIDRSGVSGMSSSGEIDTKFEIKHYR